jgi:dolichol-phosphate mannosyltransferase
MDLSIVILTLNERDNIAVLIPRIRKMLDPVLARSQYEILIVDGGSTDGTQQVVAELADRVVVQSRPGYGQALQEGFAAAGGEYIATLDADLSHEPAFLLALWQERATADILIASRYVPGGKVDMPWSRTVLSHILNLIFRTVLALPIRDLSSGFRLYHTRTLRELSCGGTDFDILPEIIVRCSAQGWRVRELPFQYSPRVYGGSKARLFKFGRAYLATLGRMWRLRNSIASADYDERAYDSRIPFQRYWQRQRYRIIMNWVAPDAVTLDIGCGSSRILRDLDAVVGLDLDISKLRYMARYGKRLANGTLFSLPFCDEAFDCVVCSEVIEHVPGDERIFSEMYRVLRCGGTLIVGTPDYASWQWRTIEAIYARVIPGGYADEHISHYTLSSLKTRLERYGLQLRAVSSILGAEVILLLTKE